MKDVPKGGDRKANGEKEEEEEEEKKKKCRDQWEKSRCAKEKTEVRKIRKTTATIVFLYRR